MDLKRVRDLIDQIKDLVMQLEELLLGIPGSTPTPLPADKRYIVKAGDTLWSIAEKHYGPGHGGQYPIIFEANQPPLTDPDEIKPGQVLKIPPLVGRDKD